MKKTEHQIATIFNNVMGPIGVGPSTSNTCGPCRLAYLGGKTVRGNLKEAEVVFPADGGFSSSNGTGMRSDYAFAHGLLGRLPDDGASLLSAFEDMKDRGIGLRFIVDPEMDSRGEHLIAKLRLTDDAGETTEMLGLSKGGGVIELISLDGFEVSIGGETNLLLVWTDEKNAPVIAELLKEKYAALREYPCTVASDGDRRLLLFPTYRLAEKEFLTEIGGLDGVSRVCALPAIMPLVVRAGARPPFGDARDLEAYCERNGKTLSCAAVDYETEVGGWTEERVKAFVDGAFQAMENAIRGGMDARLRYDGITSPLASQLFRVYGENGSPISDGIVTRAALYSLAIMEYSNASGVVVCMPTAGASGTIGGVLTAAAESLGSSREQVIDALLAAGAIGVSISEDNDFCGGVYGCQAEVGCASAMAAGALTVLAGGTTGQAMNAASMALQNMLGLICDPVCGLVQVPCFSRNMGGIANAVVCANMSLLGFDGVMHLQDAFEAMKSSGRCFPTGLKGCGGGLCDTPTGRELLARFSKA